MMKYAITELEIAMKSRVMTVMNALEVDARAKVVQVEAQVMDVRVKTVEVEVRANGRFEWQTRGRRWRRHWWCRWWT
jgi:hypothetical protein